MASFLKIGSAAFEAEFSALLAAKRESAADVDAAVGAIIADVRERGDAALCELTEKFDSLSLTPQTLRISADEIDEEAAKADPAAVEALALARDRIIAYHRRQLPADDRYRDEVSSVGLYVPGGTAAYPSSVLMNSVPAQVAGVARIAMVVPAPGGVLNPLVLAAARLAGIGEIYRVGGAQAVAALAYGTPSIAPVAKIVGPGNAYVAAAKRQVFGQVGIDMIAGPSEVLIIADGGNDPRWIAADLLAQAEHDASAQSILITDSAELAAAVPLALERQLAALPRAAIAGASWRDNGAIILVEDLGQAVELANRIAAEHLEIATDDPEALASRIAHAGAIFLGRYTPEAVGDYVAGPNHVLPTARSARFASGLNVLDFMKRTTLLKCDAEGLRAIGPAAITLGRAEGLDAHADSVAIRLNIPPARREG